MKKILIALDYDQAAKKVAEAGFAVAKSMDAGVTLLHVVSDPIYYSSLEYSPIMGFTGYMEVGKSQLGSIESLKDASLQYLERIKQVLGDESIKTIVAEGDFAGSILDTAEDINAELIVLGSHGRKWLEDILIGSVTEKVLHHSVIPLLIIPTKK